MIAEVGPSPEFGTFFTAIFRRPKRIRRLEVVTDVMGEPIGGEYHRRGK
jgi:hypothetical protein